MGLFINLAGEAFADRIIGSIQGEVTNWVESGTGDVPDIVTVGDAVLLEFSYDDTEPMKPGTGSYGYGIDLALSATIEGLVWQVNTAGVSTPGPINVYDNANFLPGDSFEMFSTTILGGVVVSFPNPIPIAYAEITMRLQDDLAPYDFLSSIDLPTSMDAIDVNQVTIAGGIINTGNSNTGDAYFISYRLDASTLQLSSVPEPTAMPLFLTALAAAVYSGRRQSRP